MSGPGARTAPTGRHHHGQAGAGHDRLDAFPRVCDMDFEAARGGEGSEATMPAAVTTARAIRDGER